MPGFFVFLEANPSLVVFLLVGLVVRIGRISFDVFYFARIRRRGGLA